MGKGGQRGGEWGDRGRGQWGDLGDSWSGRWQGTAWSTAAWDSSSWSAGDQWGGKASGTKGRPARASKQEAAVAFQEIDAQLAERLRSMKVEFCPDPQSYGGRFTTTYEAEQGVNFASLNAGDEHLYLGGATINLQFAKDLQKFAGQDVRHYAKLHSEVSRLAGSQARMLFIATDAILQGDPNVEQSFVRLASKDSNEGIALVDIFRETRRPHACACNLGMVYTVGPQRRDCPSDENFLERVKVMAENVSLAVAEYNGISMAGRRIDKLRVCLVSGGAFAGRVPRESVASALCAGLAAGWNDALSPVFEFAYDGDCFRTAWHTLLDKIQEVHGGACLK